MNNEQNFHRDFMVLYSTQQQARKTETKIVPWGPRKFKEDRREALTLLNTLAKKDMD